MKPVDSLSDDEFAQLVQAAAALPEAPPRFVRAAIDLWPAPAPASVKEVSLAAWRLVAAALNFDTAAAMGLRAGASDTRHLLFSAMGRDIDLRISPAADHFALTGQVLGPDEQGVIELAAQPGGDAESVFARIASLDERGAFRLDGVLGGTYRLTLRMGRDEIVLPPIVVGERPR